MSLVIVIVIGFSVGLLARAIMPGRYPLGCIMTVLLGLSGALIGKFLGEATGLSVEGQPASFALSLLGALIVLFLFNQLKEKR